MPTLTHDQIKQLEDYLYQGVRLRTEAEAGAPPPIETAHAWKKLDAYKTLPEWFHADDLAGVDGFVHPKHLLDDLTGASKALNPLRDYLERIRLVFYRKPKKPKGTFVWGRAVKLGAKEVALTGGRWWWDIELSLAAWALLDPIGRLKLLHHEAMHLSLELDKEGEIVPAIRTHDVEAFTATLAELGPMHTGELAYLAAGAKRSEVIEAGRDPVFQKTISEAGLDFKPLDAWEAGDGSAIVIKQASLFGVGGGEE